MIASTFRSSAIAMLAAAALTVSAPVGALAPESTRRVTPVDIQRLQDRVFSLSSDLSRLRTRDSSTASRLEGDLDDLRDEVVHCASSCARKGACSAPNTPTCAIASTRSARASAVRVLVLILIAIDYAFARRRSPAPGGRAPARHQRRRQRLAPARAPRYASPDQCRSPESTLARHSSGRRGTREIPVGQELDIRLQTPLSSDTAQVEDRFEATTIVDMYEGNQLLVPAGSVLRGVVSSVKRAGRLERKGVLTLSFDQLTVDGRDYPIRATVTQAIESSGVRGEAGKIGAGAGVGAIIGGILGGFKGALAGILIGGGGTIAATEGTDVKLDSGTILRIRFDSPVPLERSTSSSR